MWAFFSRDASKDFPYDIGDIVSEASDESIWSLHKGKKRGTSEEVSIFVFDIRNNGENKIDIARATVKKLKILRHPSILTYLHSYESDRVLYLATEYVEPLSHHLQNISKDAHERELYLSWGIFQITRALSFLNNDGCLRHNNVCSLTVFVNAAGEWKLGGVEHMNSVNEELGVPIKVLQSLEKYSPPEKADALKQRHITRCSTDMWGLGCLIWEVFNGSLSQTSDLYNTHKIPKSLLPVYSELILPSPNSRPNPADVITKCRKNDGFFKNDLVDSLIFLEEIQIKDKNEKNRFFSSLTSLLDHFPDNICKYKILPHLINAFEFGDAGAAVLTPVLKLGKLLDDADYQKKIVPCVVKLFNNNDRGTRSKLLQQLQHYISHLQSSTINDQIFPQIANGFLDTNTMIRGMTVESVIHLAPKLNYNNLNIEILRHFARLQSKDDPGIRTNTTICMGKIAQHLHPQIRQKVLVSAFIRAMRDPFPPSRIAGIKALAATHQYYLLSEVSSRILPAFCQLTVDPDKSVRENVFRTIKGFLGKLEKVSEDPTIKDSMEADVHASTPSLSNATSTWTGWAVTAVTAKFYRSQSDITKSNTPHINKNFHKPASLDQPPLPSSSSISTTTTSSEVTSNTSFEQEAALDSVSDYDDTWEPENWGDIQTTEDKNSQDTKMSLQNITNETKSSTDGWDVDEWSPVTMDEVTADKEYNQNLSSTTSTGWDNDEWNTIDESEENNKQEDLRKQREEKKYQRQKELEAKRMSRQSGMSKLGAKKI